MNTKANTSPVMSDDIKASLLAAFARVEALPVGETLIDQVSEELWHDDGADHWNIAAGGSVSSDDELDDCDEGQVFVA